MNDLLSLNIKFEKAVRLLSKYFVVSDKKSRKPVLFHDIRVGVYLYERGYKEEIVLAGILHDALEFSKITPAMIKKDFGPEVLRLVKACTKNDSITDSNSKLEELIRRGVDNGVDALIVKCADILDSFKWYSAQKNISELDYCRRNANAIFKFKPKDFQDPIFKELKKF
ncbi:MAG: HD domain-containing protein [Patescibacteria group bacterium]